MAPDVEKRLRYFDGQFLQEKDFADEQAYHIDRQRRHNRLLHTPGIAEGLDVKADKGAREAKVMPGTAVDAEGRPIVLAHERTVRLEQHFGQTVLVISYSEEEADQATVGDPKNTRWHEHPRVEVFSENETPSPDTHIRLAHLVISKEGTVSSEPDTSVRKGAGPRWGGEAEAGRLKLARAGVDSGQWPSLSCSAANQVEVAGNLTVTGNVDIDIGTAEPQSPLSVSGSGAIGVDYVAKAAPANGLIVQGNVGIGTTSPEATLDIRGTLKANVTMVGLMFRGEEKNYVEIPKMNPDYANGFTVEAWVRYRSTQLWSRIIDFGNGADKDNIFLANSKTTTDLWFEVHRDGEKLAVTAAGALEIGTWMHLTATVDRSGQATLYKNGQLLVIGNVLVPATLNRTKNHIGRSNWEDNRYFDGEIAEVAIWNCARTAAEINHDMNTKLSGSENGLVGYWPCDEGAGNQVKDKAREQHHGTIHGATWFQEDIPAITIGEYGNVDIGTAVPKRPLSVNGNIGLGPDASLYAPGGVENLMLIRGTVAPDGHILVGQGFEVEHNKDEEPGLYNITFSPAFSAKPTVVVTQQYPEKDDFTDGGGDTRDNCVVVAVSKTTCRIKCGGSDGKAADRRFHFVALGPR